MAGSGTPEYQEYRSLRQLLTICQLYHGRQFIGSGTPEYQVQTTDLPQVADKIYLMTTTRI
jgi:hypothetical protein